MTGSKMTIMAKAIKETNSLCLGDSNLSHFQGCENFNSFDKNLNNFIPE
jgi:hypothetical protein